MKKMNAYRKSLCLSVAAVLYASVGIAHGEVHRGFEPRFVTNAPGDIEIIGNTLLSCSTVQRPNEGFCQEAREGMDARNNQFFMEYVDLDTNGGTFNSSAADLSLPPNGEVIWAGLYWGARLSAGKFGGNVAPERRLAGQVLFRSSDGNYAEFIAEQLDSYASTFSAFAPVTDVVRGQAPGTTQRYWVANVQAGTGGNRHAGWALVVVYRDPAQALRNLAVFDGYADVRVREPVETVVEGFSTPLSGDFGIRVGSVAFDGDLNLRGDRLTINGTALKHPGAAGSPVNFFDAGISRLGERVSAKDPDFVNQLGVDIGVFDVDGGIENGEHSADVGFSSRGDIYYPAVLTFVMEVFQPTLAEKFAASVSDENGGDPLPGEVLRYELAFENTGEDPAAQVVLSASIPEGTIFEPGSLEILRDDGAPSNMGSHSDAPGDDVAEFDGQRVVFRLGHGASSSGGGTLNHANYPEPGDVGEAAAISFKVRVSGDVATFPAAVSQQARLSYAGFSTGDAFENLSSLTAIDVLQPPTSQIAVANEIVMPGPVDNLDGTHTLKLRVVVRNEGDTDLSAVALKDNLAETFKGAAFVLDKVQVMSSSATLVANPEFSGTAPHTNLLHDSSELPAGASGTVTLDLTVTPGDDPGPYQNMVRGAGTTFFSLSYEDQSNNGAEPDANGDGDAGNDNEPTLVTFNSPPVSADDNATVLFGASTIVDVLANDSDVDGDALSVISFEHSNPPEFGTLIDNGDGTFSYKAPAIEPEGYGGGFEFSYIVADPAGQSATAKARVGVPTAEADLAVDVDASPDPAEAGGLIMLSVRALNFGPQNADPRVAAFLLDGYTFVSAHPSQGEYDAESGQWQVGMLGGGTKKLPKEASLVIEAEVGVDGEYAHSATISAPNIVDLRDGNDVSSLRPDILRPSLALKPRMRGKRVADEEGSFVVTYEFEVRNTGKVDVGNLKITKDFGRTFADAESFAVVSVTGDLSINPEFDGRAVTQLLTGDDTLAAKSRAKVLVEVKLSPGVNLGPYKGKVAAAAESMAGIVVGDEAFSPELRFKAPLARVVERAGDSDDGVEEAE